MNRFFFFAIHSSASLLFTLANYINIYKKKKLIKYIIFVLFSCE